MKYFAVKSARPTGYMRDATAGETYEITSKYAKVLYEHGFKKGELNLRAMPAYRKGEKLSRSYYTIWGENISKKELFRRRLAGEVAKEVIG